MLGALYALLAADIASVDDAQVWLPESARRPNHMSIQKPDGTDAVYINEHVVLCAAIHWRIFKNALRRHAKVAQVLGDRGRS